jgi:hypothetical protein
MFPHSNLIMYALYDDRQREIERILRFRRAAGMRSTAHSGALRHVANWVGERLVAWGQQLQAQADVAAQDAIVQQ